MHRRAFLAGVVGASAWFSRPVRAISIAGPGNGRTPAEFNAARRFADLEMGRIAYVECGAGPVAIFLHGFPLNGFQWRAPMAGLASFRRCVALDLMGLGYSDVPAEADLSPIAQAKMVLMFMETLGITEADIVSNDSATGIAQLIVAMRPEAVRSLLLTNGDVDTNSPPVKLLPFIEQARRGEVDTWYERHLTDNDFARSSRGIGNAFRHPETALPHDTIEVYFRPLVSSEKRRKQGQQYGVAMSPNPLPAIEGRLRAYDRPVRIVWARDNPLFPDWWAHWLDRIFPGSTGIRFVGDARLFFPEERPDVIVAEAKKLWGVG